MEEIKGKCNKCNIKSKTLIIKKKKKQSVLAFIGNNKKIVYLSLENVGGETTSLVKLCSELMSHWEPRGSGLQRHNDKCNTSSPSVHTDTETGNHPLPLLAAVRCFQTCDTCKHEA